MNYKKSGVDIDRADLLIRRIKPLIRKTERREALSTIGHYAGLFALGRKYRSPVLCASTDGVGTKVKLALEADQWGGHGLEGLGQDLVAMSANDILCLGAEPLFFLDYYATGRLDLRRAERIIKGITTACAAIRCTLLGGETAEMPAVYRDRDVDLAGFILGVVEKKRIVSGKGIRPGDLVVGLASSGPHSNGFSLIRQILRARRLSLSKVYPPLKQPLGKVLLKPTRLYGNPVLKVARHFDLHGIAHITGGGFKNIPRILPADCQAVLDLNSWKRPAIFDLLQGWGGIKEAEMQRVFNLGLGLVLVVKAGEARGICKNLRALGETPWISGRIVKRPHGASPLSVIPRREGR